jgi:hypothetical protein
MPRARAPVVDVDTVEEVPRNRPPQRTKNGSLRASQSPVCAPPLPVRSTDFERDVAIGPSPLVGLRRPTTYDPAGRVVAIRNLDSGRLSADSIVTAAGWEPSTALDADASQPQRIALRPAVADRGPVAGSLSAHTDSGNRIVVSTGLRTFLGIGPNDPVVAWTDGAGIVQLAPAGVVIDAFAALDRHANQPSHQPLLTAVPTA